MSAMAASDSASNKYGLTCAAESRNHIAGISQVMTKVVSSSGGRIVVSYVLVEHFSNLAQPFLSSLYCSYTFSINLCMDIGNCVVMLNSPYTIYLDSA